jgi:Ni,Fe-hydrogenase III large subunit
MSSSVIVHQVAAAAVPVLEIKAWRDEVLRLDREGARMITLYGRRPSPDEHDIVITAVFQRPAGTLELTRTHATVDHGYHELTSELPAVHAFERELHEQTGMRIAGHPWLKPIRYEGGQAPAMNGYPFYKVEGKEVHEVAVGPIHAGVIEPGAFRFMCHGEQVHHLEIHLGYQHRGVERRLLEGNPRGLAPLAETIAGDTSVGHAWAYCAALESLAGCELLEGVELARAALLELERVAMHLAGMAGMATDLGFLQGATTYGRLRTTAINTTMRLCGSRFGRGALRPGRLGLQAPVDLARDVGPGVALMQRDLAIINECFLDAHTVQHRLKEVGVLTRAQAETLGLVGMAARASGVSLDARQQTTHGAYHQFPIAPVVLTDGDCWARTRLRIEEMDASLAWLQRACDRGDPGTQPVFAVEALASGQIAVALVEGWRGEIVHVIETDAGGNLAHYKVQDPSLRNWMGLAMAVRGNEISDFPICNKSFDLSYCGNDL